MPTSSAPNPLRVNPQLVPLLRPMASLQLDPRNARVHGERNLDAIVASLKDHGQQKPIVVDPSGIVLAGNGTFAAAQRLGATQIAALVYDGPAGSRFAIADNRTAELAEWDDRILAELLKEMQEAGDDTTLVGFSSDEAAKLMAVLDAAEAPEDFAEVDEDVATNHNCPRCGYVWSE